MAGALTAAIAAAFSGSAVVSDPYFEYTTLLLPGNGTNGAQNNTFLDGSTNNFTITRNGNTTQGTFSPFSQTGWGNYFNGTNAYLSTPSITIGSGDFTIEGWQYILPDGTDYGRFFSVNDFQTSPGLAISFNPSTFKFEVAVAPGSALIASSGTFSYNTWYHIALVRSGGSITLYINGTSQGSASNSTSFSGVVYISAVYFASVIYYGASYTSNVRITTTAIVPPAGGPTAPLTAVTGTLLLTCQSNRFIDTNTQVAAKTITVNGSPAVVAFSPFNPTASWSAATYGGSGYFDGSGDYLSVADNTNLRFGTNAFTIQAWVYRNASGAAHSIIAKGGASTGYVLQVTSTNVLRFTHGTTNVDTTTTIPASAWTHVAAVRTNTSTNGFQLYINGVSSATATVATDFNQTDTLYIGSDRSAANVMNGYISGLKYTNGTAESISVPTEPPTATTNVALLTNFTNAGIYDATSKNDLETVGNAQISTTQSKWGGSSMYFDGNGDWLAAPTSILPQFGTGDFTIEFWWYPNSLATAQQIISNTNDSAVTGSGEFVITYNTSLGLRFYINAGAADIQQGSTTGWTTGQWYYVAAVRSGNTLTLYRNGSSIASGSVTGITIGANVPFYIGGEPTQPTSINGYLQDVRITKGYARTVTTSPTAAFPTL